MGSGSDAIALSVTHIRLILLIRLIRVDLLLLPFCFYSSRGTLYEP
jgi:hypothetical protein